MSTRFVIAVVALALVSKCSTDAPLAGGCEVGNPSSVAGSVTYGDGRGPAGGALVRVRRADYLADTARYQGLWDTASASFTDGSGEFRVDSLDSGNYWIEVSDRIGFASIVKCRLQPDGGCVRLPEAVLRPLARLEGSIRSGEGSPARSYVQVYGVERVAITDTAGNFRLDLPADTFSIRVTSSIPDHGPLNLSNVLTKPDSARTLPSLFQFTTCGTPECDSLVLSGIIDSLGIGGVAGADIAIKDSRNRVTGLVFDGIVLEQVPQTLSKLPYLGSISLNRCSLGAFPPALCRLRNLRSISLRGNTISVIPDEIAWNPMLDTFDIGANRLTAIPDEIAFMRDLSVFRCDSNPLTAVADEIGVLTEVKSVSLAATGISSLPLSVGGMSALAELDLSNNEFTTVPVSLMTLPSLRRLIADGNRICSPPDSVVRWLDEVSPDWSRTQTCP